MMLDVGGEDFRMRTTLSIADDVLVAVRGLAEQSNRSIGEVVSELVRASLWPKGELRERNGVPLLPMRQAGAVVTPEIVNALRDEGA
jgi:hypothetical protein